MYIICKREPKFFFTVLNLFFATVVCYRVYDHHMNCDQAFSFTPYVCYVLLISLNLLYTLNLTLCYHNFYKTSLYRRNSYLIAIQSFYVSL